METSTQHPRPDFIQLLNLFPGLTHRIDTIYGGELNPAIATPEDYTIGSAINNLVEAGVCIDIDLIQTSSLQKSDEIEQEILGMNQQYQAWYEMINSIKLDDEIIAQRLKGVLDPIRRKMAKLEKKYDFLDFFMPQTIKRLSISQEDYNIFYALLTERGMQDPEILQVLLAIRTFSRSWMTELNNQRNDARTAFYQDVKIIRNVVGRNIKGELFGYDNNDNRQTESPVAEVPVQRGVNLSSLAERLKFKSPDYLLSQTDFRKLINDVSGYNVSDIDPRFASQFRDNLTRMTKLTSDRKSQHSMRLQSFIDGDDASQMEMIDAGLVNKYIKLLEAQNELIRKTRNLQNLE